MKANNFGILSLYVFTAIILICLFCMNEQLKCNRNEIIGTQVALSSTLDLLDKYKKNLDKIIELEELTIDIIEQYHPK